jgi:hypothetical protein
MLFARSLISPGTLFSFSYFICLQFSLCAPTGLQPRIWFLFINFVVSGVLGVEITVTPSHNIFFFAYQVNAFRLVSKRCMSQAIREILKKIMMNGFA